MSLFTYGIDVSVHNGKIDWARVKASTDPKIDYAYIKATEGASNLDAMAATNGAGAAAVKMPFGYYHFAYMNGTNPIADAIAEARFFSARLKALPKGDHAPVLDIESNPGGFTPYQVQVWIDTFLKEMKKLGHPKVILYSYASFFNDNLPANHPFGNIPLWLAAYVNLATPLLPRGWKNFTLWQFSAKARVPGISGDVDINKTTPDLLTLLKVGGIGLAGLAITIALFFLGYKWVNRKKKNR